MELQVQWLLPVSGKLTENEQVVRHNNWYFLPLGEALPQSSEILEEYLHIQPLQPENLTGGLDIVVDGQHWNQFYFGQFWQTMQWVSGIRRLVNGEKMVLISVFDDSRLLLKRHQNQLMLYETWDDYYPRTDFCPEITLDFQDFTTQLLRESGYFATFITRIQELIAKKDKKNLSEKLILISTQLSPAFAEKIRELEEKLSFYNS